MASFNKVILAGNLTRDPELRYASNGRAIAKFGLAISRNWTTETGEKKEEVTFVDVDAFGKEAEHIGQYFKKGRPILFEGRLRLDTWDDKQTGQKRNKLNVVLERFSFIDSNRAGEGGDGADSGVPRSRPAPSRPASAPVAAPSASEDSGPPSEDDVPF